MGVFEDRYWVRVEPEPRACAGVYVWKFPAGFVYCGASFDVKARLVEHVGKLEAGEHRNARLQSAWDECGGEGVLVVWRALVLDSPEQLQGFEVRLLEHWRGRVGAARLLNISMHPVAIRRPGRRGGRAAFPR